MHRHPRPPARRAALFFAVALVALLLAPTLAEAAKVTYLVRPAQVLRKGTTAWKTLNLGDEVFEGDSIRTGNGARVELSITPKRQFRIGQATEIKLEGLEEKPGGIKARFGLILGRFWGSLRQPLKPDQGDQFNVATATATIGVKGTTFGVDYDKKTDVSQVAVVTGTVGVVPPPQPEAPVEIAGPREIAPPQEVTRADWNIIVSRDQKVIIRPGEEPRTEPLTDEDKRDEWIAFNIARDNADQ